MSLRKTPRYTLLTVGYAALIQASCLAALLLRFEGAVAARFWSGYLQIAPIFTVLSLVGFYLAGLYDGLWRYASTVTLFEVFMAVTLSTLMLAIGLLFSPLRGRPRSWVL